MILAIGRIDHLFFKVSEMIILISSNSSLRVLLVELGG